jgi:hypothetical protein
MERENGKEKSRCIAVGVVEILTCGVSQRLGIERTLKQRKEVDKMQDNGEGKGKVYEETDISAGP